MHQLVLLLEAALVIVMLVVLWELLRLRREVQLSQMALPRVDDVRRAEKSFRDASAEAQHKAQWLADKLETLCEEAERLTSREGRQAVVELVGETLPADLLLGRESALEAEPVQSGSGLRQGPRVLSEVGRAKYDRVLRLAADGLGVDTIAREVDLTRAEVELMLGTAS